MTVVGQGTRSFFRLFDLLGPHHVKLLQTAKAKGDRLVVAVNNDFSVRALKGPDRPIRYLDARTAMLMALECVDAVFVFDGDVEPVIRNLAPVIYVKAEPRRKVRVSGKQCTERVVTLPRVRGESTTETIERIRNGRRY